MRTYTVFRSPDTGYYYAFKRGFNWPAFFFTYLWMLLHRVPRPSFSGYWPAMFLLALVVVLVNLTRWTDDPVVGTLSVLAMLGCGIYIGKMGNKWLIIDSATKNWKHIATVDAKTSWDAIQKSKSAGNQTGLDAPSIAPAPRNET